MNIPLRDGMDDESYESIFVPIISKVMETFQPSAVVLQCGADSLTGIVHFKIKLSTHKIQTHKALHFLIFSSLLSRG